MNMRINATHCTLFQYVYKTPVIYRIIMITTKKYSPIDPFYISIPYRMRGHLCVDVGTADQRQINFKFYEVCRLFALICVYWLQLQYKGKQDRIRKFRQLLDTLVCTGPDGRNRFMNTLVYVVEDGDVIEVKTKVNAVFKEKNMVASDLTGEPGCEVISLHAPPNHVNRALTRFMKGRSHVLVVTDKINTTSINLPDFQHVINFELGSRRSTVFNDRLASVGRFSHKGTCHTFLGPYEDVAVANNIIKVGAVE